MAIVEAAMVLLEALQSHLTLRGEALVDVFKNRVAYSTASNSI